MRGPIAWCAVVLAAGATIGAAQGADTLTWQEANQRSAALIREKGPSAEAADLARRAFALYPVQTKAYNPANHAQLLLNAADARLRAEGIDAALQDIDDGVDALVGKAGPDAEVLIAIWQEAARIAGHGTSQAGRYSERARGKAERLYGADDPRTIRSTLDVVRDRRRELGYVGATNKLVAARQRAAKGGEDTRLVAEIDLLLAKTYLEVGRTGAAIEAYQVLVDRLESRGERDLDLLLQAGYAQLEYAYERRGDKAAAGKIRERRIARVAGGPHELTPTLKVQPQYPRLAVRDGIEGFVLLEIEVGADGTVTGLKVLDSHPAEVFEEATLTAVSRWKFKPKVVDGKAVPSSGSQLMQFRLQRSS